MTDISTDVLIIGTGPAGSATAALLSCQGVPNLVVNRYRWLANTPRAPTPNQRTMELLEQQRGEVGGQLRELASRRKARAAYAANSP